MRSFPFVLLFLLLRPGLLSVSDAQAVVPTRTASSQSARAAAFDSDAFWDASRLPVSFRYRGRESDQLLPGWAATVERRPAGRVLYSFADPETGLRVMADVRTYPEFPGVVDWVLRFRDDGHADTPILEDILPLRLLVPLEQGAAEFVLHHAKGSDARADDFAPLDERVRVGHGLHLESPGGDPSSKNSLPFFNLQTGASQGVIGAIGWTGDWKADFEASKEERTVLVRSGMKRTHLILHAGEEIRTARIVLLPWSGGDWAASQNRWRRLLLQHYTPQEHGAAMKGPVLFGSWGSEPIADKLAYIRFVHEQGIPLDVYAVDAGWYGASFGAETDPTNPWWKNRGDWFPSPRYYPNGIRPLGEALKAAAIGFSLWIEPETTMTGRQIEREHPEWYLRSDKPAQAGVELANLGDPTVRQGLTALVSGFISEFGMTWYRQDFNIPPERYWEMADAPDRIGMTQIRHVEGLYQMWDDLLAAHPGLHIDNCASGGRRLDIEMMARSFAVWRTDYGFLDTLAEQAQTQALAAWVPQNMGFETYSNSKPWNSEAPFDKPGNVYLMRLGYSAGYGVGPGAAGVRNAAWVRWIKAALAEYRAVQPYLQADFYPLLPYSLDAESWTAWQWDRPERGDGAVMVMRRPRSPFPSIELPLRQVEPRARYRVEIRRGLGSAARANVFETDGKRLERLELRLPEAPSSVLVFYRRLRS